MKNISTGGQSRPLGRRKVRADKFVDVQGVRTRYLDAGVEHGDQAAAGRVQRAGDGER